MRGTRCHLFQFRNGQGKRKSCAGVATTVLVLLLWSGFMLASVYNNEKGDFFFLIEKYQLCFFVVFIEAGNVVWLCANVMCFLMIGFGGCVYEFVGWLLLKVASLFWKRSLPVVCLLCKFMLKLTCAIP